MATSQRHGTHKRKQTDRTLEGGLTLKDRGGTCNSCTTQRRSSRTGLRHYIIQT